MPSTQAQQMYSGFFTYRGPGSQTAQHTCKHCRYADEAHGIPHPFICDRFEPIGDVGTDEYYDGCRGWD